MDTIDDLIMNQEQIRTYVLDRRFSSDNMQRQQQLEGLKKIMVHNGFTEDEVRQELIRSGVSFYEYNPKESSEGHFYDHSQGIIHVVNTRGDTRLVRDKDLGWAIGEILKMNVETSIVHFEDSPSRASQRFTQFAFDLVDGAINLITKDHIISHLYGGAPIKVILSPNQIHDNSTLNIMMGPHKSLDLSGVEVLHKEQNDFLNYHIFRIKEKIAISFDYIFADQAVNVLQKLYSKLSAEFKGVNVNVFHYGKVGVLNPEYNVGDVFVPTATISERAILKGRKDKRTSPIYNELSGDNAEAEIFRKYVGTYYKGTAVNTTTVLRQTKKNLQLDLDAKGDLIEMEWAGMSGLDNGHETRHPNLGDIRYFFAGVGSDKPLVGEVLGNTQYDKPKEGINTKVYPRDVERRIAQTYLKIIAQVH